MFNTKPQADQKLRFTSIERMQNLTILGIVALFLFMFMYRDTKGPKFMRKMLRLKKLHLHIRGDF